MELTEVSKRYVFTTRVNIDDENFIELREPNQMELQQVAKKDGNELDAMSTLFPKCVIDSSFTHDGIKATGTEIYNELKNSGSLFTDVLTTWLESIPFQHRLLKKEK